MFSHQKTIRNRGVTRHVSAHMSRLDSVPTRVDLLCVCRNSFAESMITTWDAGGSAVCYLCTFVHKYKYNDSINKKISLFPVPTLGQWSENCGLICGRTNKVLPL